MGSVPQCLAGDQDGVGAQRGDLAGFRVLFYESLNARADELFELADALLCADGPVRSLVELSLAPEHRRGHGALYDGLNHGSDRKSTRLNSSHSSISYAVFCLKKK